MVAAVILLVTARFAGQETGWLEAVAEAETRRWGSDWRSLSLCDLGVSSISNFQCSGGLSLQCGTTLSSDVSHCHPPLCFRQAV